MNEWNRLNTRRKIKALEHEVTQLTKRLNGKDIYEKMDYLSFENQFRGSREHVKEMQRSYASYFAGRKQVVELGAGRGEFMELLKENEIPYVGVDISETLVQMCREQGLNAVCADALTYVKSLEHADGIFASQLIEHLPFSDVIELCKVCYEKLEEGAYMILETPNPMSLAIFTHSFYIDPSHVKPVHPFTLKYVAEKAGFREVELLFTDSSKFPVEIPALESCGTEQMEEFNRSMKRVENALFGSQDYALIARK